MEEFVFFIFVDGEKIMIEQRVAESEEPHKVFLLCGGIQDQDRNSDEDYRVAAMKREIREELGDGIQITDFEFLTMAETPDPFRMYHSYLIRKWEGELPKIGLEEGKKNAELHWVPIEEAFMTLDSDVARLVAGKALAQLREEALTRSYAALNES